MKLGEEQLKGLHRVLLEQLKFFKNFCEENGLTFYLAYGTCLGAVRHHGFIPWDDDVDIIMPPEDIERLRKLWPPQTSKGRYMLCESTRDYCDHHISITIRDTETTYITKGDLDSDTNHGIMIEIGSYSYAPRSLIGRGAQDVATALYLIFKAGRIPNSGGRLQKTTVKLMLSVVRSNRARYNVWRFCDRIRLNKNGKNARYVRTFGQFHTFSKFYPTRIFSGVKWVPFEDTTMPIPAGYKKYLEILYGDYMTPPPEEDRKPVHEVLFVDCDKGYRHYRGTEYLKGAMTPAEKKAAADRAAEEYKIDPKLRTVQLACLEILKKYREVCEKHGLRYYLAYGTLLGAVRHGGYIPWDDDIDVWMPRKDFERFLKICESELSPYVINYYSIDNNAAFKYRTQLCIEDHKVRVGFKLGNGIKKGYIWIDVMTMDGMPKNRLLRKLQCRRFSFWYAVIGLARSSRIGASNPKGKKGIKKIAVKINSKLKIGRLIDIKKAFAGFKRTKMRYDFDSSEYVHGTTSYYTDKAVFRREWFDGERSAEFEGELFAIPSGAEKILKSVYGDYMLVPSPEKRGQAHFMLLDEETTDGK